MTNKIIGKQGEILAADFLKKRGFRILEMNFKYSKLAEIDIIAFKDNIIHFVEVKTRTGTLFGSPFEAINQKKLSSIYSCAQYYLKITKIKYKSFQIDGIGIILKDKTPSEISFLENISL